MKKLLENKLAVLTGCGHGIGKETLIKFAEHGASIVACTRTFNEEFVHMCRKIEDKYKVKIWPTYFDLSDFESMKKIYLLVKENNLSIDILVNNAGVYYSALFAMTSLDNINNIIDLNFIGTLKFTQYMIKCMKKNTSSSIINIASSAAYDCAEGQTAYASSKAAIIAATKVLSKEYGKYGIRANIIAPGPVSTNMLKEVEKTTDRKNIIDSICLKRIAHPEEIANAILFFASNMSTYITGTVLHVDGGMNCGDR